MSQGEYYQARLEEVIRRFPDEYSLVEIGTDAGTTAMYALDLMRKNKSKKWLFTVDPYGDKPYRAGNDTWGHKMGYDDANYRITHATLSQFAARNELNFVHWKITSDDFIKVFPQVTFWTDGVKLKEKFAFAFLDGDHAWEVVREEFKWFYARMESAAIICIDDFNLIGGEEFIREHLAEYDGKWVFNYDDAHERCYFTKK